jgi:hypothetical protein
MTLQEIKTKVDSGIEVFWKNKGYQVIKDRNDNYQIEHKQNENFAGIINIHGELMGQEKDFFVDPLKTFNAIQGFKIDLSRFQYNDEYIPTEYLFEKRFGVYRPAQKILQDATPQETSAMVFASHSEAGHHFFQLLGEDTSKENWEALTKALESLKRNDIAKLGDKIYIVDSLNILGD